MKIDVNDPPRELRGRLGGEPITIRDCGRLRARRPTSRSRFVTESGGEYDVARKDWGFYATPSLNARLERFGFRPALVRSGNDKFYVFLLERGGEAELDRYLRLEGHLVVAWLDDPETLRRWRPASGDRRPCPPGRRPACAPSPSCRWCTCSTSRRRARSASPPPGSALPAAAAALRALRALRLLA